MPCNSKILTSYQCARGLHGNVMFVIRMLNSVYLSLFLDMFPLRPNCPLVNEMSLHIYTTHVSGILGLGGNRVVDVKEDNIQLKTFNIRWQIQYSVSKYTETSTVQIHVYQMVSWRG